MNESSESNAGDMAAGAIDTLKLPNGFGSLWEVVGEEATSVLFRERTGKSPFVEV